MTEQAPRLCELGICHAVVLEHPDTHDFWRRICPKFSASVGPLFETDERDCAYAALFAKRTMIVDDYFEGGL